MIGNYLDKYTFQYLITQALAKVPDDIDKREGSIIYDALAPACYQLTEYYMQLKQILENTFISTAHGEYLDLRVAEMGLTRYDASYAIKRADFLTSSDTPASIIIGSRFSTLSNDPSVNYQVTAVYKDGEGNVVPGAYELTCEALGTIGNGYVGTLIPITYISNLKTATMSDLITPARDAETDEELKGRYLLKVNTAPFGGNLSQYDSQLKSIDGVGEVQIYPTWNGGGTVKISIVDSEYNTISEDFIQDLQDIIDPSPQASGLGLAPIGHEVTITTPTELLININANVVLSNGYTLGQVTPLINAALETYMLSLRRNWGIGNDLNHYYLAVYVARVNATILEIQGITNVTGTTINGAAEDLILTEGELTQHLPILGTVTVNE